MSTTVLSAVTAVCDLGNTRLKWGVGRLAAGRIEWLARGALAYDEIAELPARLAAAGDADVLACSVTDAAREAAFAALLYAAGRRLRWFRPTSEFAGLRNGYRDPAQLGADRWAALVGAWLGTRGSALLVGAGTATTIDVLRADDDGTPEAEGGATPTEGVAGSAGGGAAFLGGVILPGVSLMADALVAGTARLPRSEAGSQASLSRLPDNTAEAIAAGTLHAQVGAIERLRRSLPPGAPCLLSGGAGGVLLPHLAPPVRLVDDLVLEGLLRAANPA